MPYKQFLGYEKGDDGQPRIVESEAETVRLIYRLFMNGKPPSSIARHLTNRGILSPAGKEIWRVSTVLSILRNEKYKGDALLQKKFTVDFLTKKQKINRGEVPQYYVENSHPAIIEPEEFDAAQAEMERRKMMGKPVACSSPLSSRLVCGDCGGFYGSKVWSSNTKYRKVVWQCNEKYRSTRKCTTPHVTEDEVKEKFLTAFNAVLEYRDELVNDCRLAQATLCDCGGIQDEIDALSQEAEVISGLVRKDIREGAKHGQRTDELRKRSGQHLEKQRKALARIAELEGLKCKRKLKALTIERFIRGIEGQKAALTGFDERLWAIMVEKVMVAGDGVLTFCFRDGTERKV